MNKIFSPMNLQYLAKDVDLDTASLAVKEIMQSRKNPFLPSKLYIFTTPTKKED